MMVVVVLVAGKYCWIKNHQDHEKSGFWSGVLRLSLSAVQSQQQQQQHCFVSLVWNAVKQTKQ